MCCRKQKMIPDMCVSRGTEVASASAGVSPQRYGNQVEGQMPSEGGSDDQEVVSSYDRIGKF